MNPRKETTSNPRTSGIFTRELEFPMNEEVDLADITVEVSQVVRESGFVQGTVTVFVPGATGAITCLEFEPGVIADFKAAIERLFPREMAYDHNLYQSDGNGHAHVRAGMIGPSLSVPLNDGELITGTWQQIVLVNFDNRRRSRRVVVQVAGA